MKILFLSGHAHLALDLTAECSSGGAELQVALLAKELVRRNQEVVLVAADTGQGDHVMQEGVKIRNGGRFDTGKCWDTLRAMPPIIRILKEERPDFVVVYGWTSWLYFLAIWSSFRNYKLLFICALDSEIDGGFRNAHPWRGKLFQKGMERCDVRLAITKHQTKLFLQQGMRCEVMRLLLQGDLSPNRLVDGEKKSIDLLWVARCNRVKQPMLFLDLAAKFPQARCRMICSNQDEQLWNEVKQRAIMMPHVEFLDKVPYHEIQSHFDEAKIFVNTSRDEGVPNTFIHAGLASTAIVSLKVDPDQMFQYFEAGACADNKIEVLIEKIQQLLGNEQRLHQAQQEASRFVREWHDNKTNIDVFLKALHSQMIKF